MTACRRALKHAGLVAGDIDFVLGYSALPEHLGAPNVCALHRRLGLRRTCLSLSTDLSFNAFSVQLELAKCLIASGRHRYGLLYQSSVLSRLIPIDAHFAPWFGDGATAIVVGPARAGWGIFATAHRTDGRLAEAVKAGVKGGAWYNAPLMVALAQRQGQLRHGDAVVIHTGGLGITWSAVVVRWGDGGISTSPERGRLDG